MKKITLRDYYLYHIIPETDRDKTFKYYFDAYHFIFSTILDVLVIAEPTDDYPKLKAYLSGRDFGSSQHKNSCYLDENLFNLYGARNINSIIYNFMYSKPFVTSDGEPVEQPYGDYNFELARNILMYYGKRWEQYLGELEISYNPIHNYDMVEDEKVNSSVTVTNNTDRSTNGFNSSTPTLVDKDENTVTTIGDWDDNKRNLTRSGNIGVTTSQQMLESEIKLRDNNIFIKRVLKDVANYITVGVYD